MKCWTFLMFESNYGRIKIIHDDMRKQVPHEFESNYGRIKMGISEESKSPRRRLNRTMVGLK